MLPNNTAQNPTSSAFLIERPQRLTIPFVFASGHS
ncbi:MAG: hypothetical protein K0Q70_2491, partial [Rhodospirillales bacterium]|nr:hypothetical protein [Rhodospirillales bacterium]